MNGPLWHEILLSSMAPEKLKEHGFHAAILYRFSPAALSELYFFI